MAFVPMFLFFLSLILVQVKILPAGVGRQIAIVCAAINFPVILLPALEKTYHVGKATSAVLLFFAMLAWSSLLAWIFWKMAATFQGEDEPEFDTNPEKAKFDWEGFRIRFFFGFIIGFLCGFRFVKNTTSMRTVLAASIITGILGGILFGVARPPNFWSRS